MYQIQRIAEEFIMSNIYAHTFPDTNDTEIKRSLKNLNVKFEIQNQSDKVERLNYLMEQFMKRKLKNTGGGYGQVHYSVIRLLLLLQKSPTNIENLDDVKNAASMRNKVYRTREEIQQMEDNNITELLKIKTEEDQVIDKIKEDWELECMSASSCGSSQSDDEDLSDNDQKNHKQGQTYNKNDKQQNNNEQEIDQHEFQFGSKLKKGLEYRKVEKGNIENTQAYFGGMPIGKIRAPIIKTVQIQSNTSKKIKKFSMNAFLDKYLAEIQPTPNPYYEYIKNKEADELEYEIQKQQKLKSILNVRTFDQLQNQLSRRVDNEDLTRNQNKAQDSLENSHMSSYNEPLNLMRDFNQSNQEKLGFLQYNTVTERQIVLDTILMMQQFETPTYYKSKQQNGRKQIFKLRQKIQLKHLTPIMLEGILGEFIQMANITKETLEFQRSLKENQAFLGMVFESFVFQVDLILQKFSSEMSDIQQIALLQAGQISKQQLTLNSISLSLVKNFVTIDEPLTLLRLKQLINAHVFKKIQLLHDIMRNGIMDFLILEDEDLLRLHDFSENSVANLDDSSNTQININQQNPSPLPQVLVDKIKAADRVTFLLNYLFVVIKNNQLLDHPELNLLKEIFIASAQPYIDIMADWIDKGQLKDPKQEFYIKANPKIFENNNQGSDNTPQTGNNQNRQGQAQDQNKNASSQSQWQDSYIFRTINLKELLGQGNQGFSPFLQAAEHQKVEVSIPIFLRPLMKEILSIGKSIKIVRYLDKLHIVKSGFQEFVDFKSIYQEKLIKEIDMFKVKEDQFSYYDEEKFQPNEKLIQCGQNNLNNYWQPTVKIGNIMNESTQIKNYRELLNIAPFQWSTNEEGTPALNSSGLNIFQLPHIQRGLDNSFASTHHSDTQFTPEKLENPNQINRHSHQNLLQLEDVEMKSISADLNDKFNESNENGIFKKSLLDNDKYMKLSSLYNYSHAELINYQDSMQNYQAYQTFDYLTKNTQDTENQKKEENLTSNKTYSFKHQTIENFVKQTLISPLHQIYIRTCSRFFKSLNTQCRFQETLKLLRQVYFMEAGHQMHQFGLSLFKQMDKGRTIDNLYMVNGQFRESVSHNSFLHKDAEFLEKIRVVFKEDPRQYAINSVTGLDYLSFQYQSDWPLEIILDKQTINYYNQILIHLLRLKRVNYVLSLKDYWLRPTQKLPKQYDQMNIKEQIMHKNRVMLDKLLHQLQITQKEFLHFSNNLEYYLKTRAIQQICNELDTKLKDLQHDYTSNEEFQSNNVSADQIDPNSMIDMDALIQIHQEFLMNIMRLCLLDLKSKILLDLVLKVLQICLNFRELCLKYLIRSEGQSGQFKDSKMPNYNNDGDSSDLSDDLGLNNLSRDEDEDEYSGSNRDKEAYYQQYGRGLLRVDSIKFMDRIEECQVELNELRSKFQTYMQILIENLKKYTKKGVFSYLDEAFIRFNFNNYYISRDREGLDSDENRV
eukprot:403351300